MSEKLKIEDLRIGQPVWLAFAKDRRDGKIVALDGEHNNVTIQFGNNGYEAYHICNVLTEEPKPKKVYKARWFVDSADGTFACIEDGYEKEFIADAFDGEAIEVKPINVELTLFEEIE